MIGSALHKAALALAAADIPVFPCQVGGKLPATAHGYLDATKDVEQINRWWGQAEFNLALCPEDAGWLVVDVDPKSGGNKTWQNLLEKHGHVDTYTNATPSGGYHHVFGGSGRSSVESLGDGVDTRGVGGYVLWPPSVVAGRPYRCVEGGSICVLPGWITEKLATPVSAREAVDDVALDLPINVARALGAVRRNLDAWPKPVEGETNIYELACEILDCGLSPDRAVQLLHEEWAPDQRLGWIETKVANASRYRQNDIGVDAVEPVSNVVAFRAYAEAHKEEISASPHKRSRFYPEDPSEQDQHPDPTWLLPGLIPDNASVLVYGGSGSFKTFLVLDMALSITNGVESAFGVKPTEQGAVFYGALEGRYELKQRRKAWELAHGIDTHDYPFYTLPAPLIASHDQCEEFVGQIRQRLQGRSAKLIVIDTVFKAMSGLKLTSDEHAGLFVQFCQTLRDEFQCAVLAIHHPSKGDTASAFGSYTLVAGFDSIARVERIPKTLHTTYTVEQHRDAAEPAQPFRFKGRVLGPSLVFQKSDAQAHSAVAQIHDQFSRTSVGGAIRRLNACDQETGVTTHVLASELSPMEDGENMERHRERIAETARKLGAMASKTLAAYCSREGKGLLWFVPASA